MHNFDLKKENFETCVVIFFLTTVFSFVKV